MVTVSRTLGNYPLFVGLVGAMLLGGSTWLLSLGLLAVLGASPVGFLLGIALATRLDGPETDHTSLERAMRGRYSTAAQQASIPDNVSAGPPTM